MKTKNKLSYQVITDKNLSLFAGYLPEFAGVFTSVKGLAAIGVIDEADRTPCGCIYARSEKNEGFMRVLHIMVDPSHRRRGIGSTLIKSFSASAKKEGLHELQLLISDNSDPSVLSFLKGLHFSASKEFGSVYRVPKPVLGSFLKNDPDAGVLKESFLIPGFFNTLKPFSELNELQKKFFNDFHIDPALSVASLGKDGRIEAFAAVSRIFGRYFLADFWSYPDKSETAAGTLYACLLQVYLSLPDDGYFTFASDRKGIKSIITYLLDPILSFGIEKDSLSVYRLKVS